MPSAATPETQPVVLGVAGAAGVVAASLSPRMMQAAFDELGLVAYYVPLAIRDRAAAKALRALPRLGFRGCNVTMPYKGVAASIAHTRSVRVERSGVANTLLVRDDGTMHAEATDGLAVVDAVRERGVELAGARITVIGAGGAAADAAAACVHAGAERVDIWNRSRARADDLAATLQKIAPALHLQIHDTMPIREPAHVLISCIPADAYDAGMLDELHTGSLVVDLAYRRDGAPTQAMVAAERRTGRCVDGREILVRQGALAFRVWFDAEAPMGAMTRAVR